MTLNWLQDDWSAFHLQAQADEVKFGAGGSPASQHVLFFIAGDLCGAPSAKASLSSVVQVTADRILGLERIARHYALKIALLTAVKGGFCNLPRFPRSPCPLRSCMGVMVFARKVREALHFNAFADPVSICEMSFEDAHPDRGLNSYFMYACHEALLKELKLLDCGADEALRQARDKAMEFFSTPGKKKDQFKTALRCKMAEGDGSSRSKQCREKWQFQSNKPYAIFYQDADRKYIAQRCLFQGVPWNGYSSEPNHLKCPGSLSSCFCDLLKWVPDSMLTPGARNEALAKFCDFGRVKLDEMPETSQPKVRLPDEAGGHSLCEDTELQTVAMMQQKHPAADGFWSMAGQDHPHCLASSNFQFDVYNNSSKHPWNQLNDIDTSLFPTAVQHQMKRPVQDFRHTSSAKRQKSDRDVVPTMWTSLQQDEEDVLVGIPVSAQSPVAVSAVVQSPQQALVPPVSPASPPPPSAAAQVVTPSRSDSQTSLPASASVLWSPSDVLVSTPNSTPRSWRADHSPCDRLSRDSATQRLLNFE